MPSCQQCVHKCNIAGDAHIKCEHPDIKANEFKIMMATFLSGSQFTEQVLGFGVNPYGLKNGWFTFPTNFDPVWMEGTCNLIETAEG